MFKRLAWGFGTTSTSHALKWSREHEVMLQSSVKNNVTSRPLEAVLYFVPLTPRWDPLFLTNACTAHMYCKFFVEGWNTTWHAETGGTSPHDLFIFVSRWWLPKTPKLYNPFKLPLNPPFACFIASSRRVTSSPSTTGGVKLSTNFFAWKATKSAIYLEKALVLGAVRRCKMGVRGCSHLVREPSTSWKSCTENMVCNKDGGESTTSVCGEQQRKNLSCCIRPRRRNIRNSSTFHGTYLPVLAAM